MVALLAFSLIGCTACQAHTDEAEEVPTAAPEPESSIEEPTYSEAEFAAAKEEVVTAINRLDNNYGGLGYMTALLGRGVDTQESRDQLQWQVAGNRAAVELKTEHSDYLAVTVEDDQAKAWCGNHETYEAFDANDVPQIVYTQPLLLGLMDCATELEPSSDMNGYNGLYCFALDAEKISSIMNISAFSIPNYAVLTISIDYRGRPEYASIEVYGLSREEPGTALQTMTEINFYDIGFVEIPSPDELY